METCTEAIARILPVHDNWQGLVIDGRETYVNSIRYEAICCREPPTPCGSALVKSVLVTGAAGFLGRYVARHFAREGWRVVGIDERTPENAELGAGDYRQILLPGQAFVELVCSAAPQVCVHCAGRAAVGLSLEDPAADYRGNTTMVFEVLDTLRRHAPACRFVLLSSAAVYGNPASLPVAEEHAVAPLSPYGYHKRQAELLCEEFARLYQLPTVCARIFSAYGPGLRRQVMWDICHRALSLGQLSLRGTGAESRDFIHATDIARALHLLATVAPAAGEIYNVASGREVTIADLAAQLLAALPSKVQPAFDGMASPGNPLNWRADTTKIAKLGFTPSVPLQAGLVAVATWCRMELAGA